MKNNNLKLLMLLLALSTCFSLNAQTEEAVVVQGHADFFGRRNQDLSKLPKMERDIEILKNVLSEIFNPKQLYYAGRGAEGIYIEGKGVMFNMGHSSRLGSGTIIADRLTVINADTGEKEEDQSVEEINKELEDGLKENSQNFLLNYASLLSELKPGEKVILNIDYTTLRERTANTYPASQTLYLTDRSAGGKRMVSEISYDDLNDFLDGKTNESSAKGKIKTSSLDKSEEQSNDTKIFAGILDDLFSQAGIEGGFKRRSRTTYTYFEGFGLMYNMKFSSSSANGVYIAVRDGVMSTSSPEEEQKKREEYYKKLEENYPAFEKALKESFMEYGRTLRSVKADEVIIVNVDLGSTNRKAKVPRSIQMVIPKQVINDYAGGKVSLENATEQIDIKKLSTAVINSSGYSYGAIAPAVGERLPVGTATVSGHGQN